MVEIHHFVFHILTIYGILKQQLLDTLADPRERHFAYTYNGHKMCKTNEFH